MKPIPDYCTLFEWEEFVDAAEMGCFIPYDGTGYYATAKEQSEIAVNLDNLQHDERFTHVAWYNK